MNNDNNNTSSIHEFDFNIICEYFSSVKRQGPGSDTTTRRAMSMIEGMDQARKIADLGCGCGSQTLQLALNSKAQVKALDLFPLFIDKTMERCRMAGVAHRVEGIVGDMGNLPFGPESLDVIWSEGAIYNIGFENGLRSWRPMLKDGGYIAVTDATWLTDRRPAEVETFWHDAYPGITDIAGNIAAIQRCGYTPVAAFVLPDKCWTTNFYEPQRHAQDIFLSRYGDDKTAQALVANQRHEAEIFSRFHQHYGYAFYIARKS